VSTRVVLRAIMDISAPAFSSADRPRMGRSGHQGQQAPERPSAISFHPLADLGRETGTMSSLPPHWCSSFVRVVRPFLRPGLHVVRGIARRDRQGWPFRLPLFWLTIGRPRLDGPEHGATVTQAVAKAQLSS
jgi:hypothetical protein